MHATVVPIVGDDLYNFVVSDDTMQGVAYRLISIVEDEAEEGHYFFYSSPMPPDGSAEIPDELEELYVVFDFVCVPEVLPDVVGRLIVAIEKGVNGLPCDDPAEYGRAITSLRDGIMMRQVMHAKLTE